jgi:hypothetical protein
MQIDLNLIKSLNMHAFNFFSLISYFISLFFIDVACQCFYASATIQFYNANVLVIKGTILAHPIIQYIAFTTPIYWIIIDK